MTATVERASDTRNGLHLQHQVLVDACGTLIDMEPFADELDGERGQWCRFFGRTIDAEPVAEGLELIAALRRLGWRYSISTTRPYAVRGLDGKTFIPQLPSIRAWVSTHLPTQPRWIYMRAGRQTGASPADVKLDHFLVTGAAPLPAMKALPAILFVDDETSVVDGLVDHGIPALTIADLAGTSDTDLEGLLLYGAAQAVAVHREHAEEERRDQTSS